jgi:hypothetical protein
MRFSNPSRVLSNSLPLLPLNLRQHPQKEGANARGFCGLIGARRPHCGASRCTSARPFSKRPSPRRILPSALNGDAQVPRRESYARTLIQTLHPALNSARAQRRNVLPVCPCGARPTLACIDKGPPQPLRGLRRSCAFRLHRPSKLHWRTYFHSARSLFNES